MRRTHVSGRTDTDDDGELVGEGDPHAQAMQAFRNVESALAEAETSLADVVRTRLFVADADDVQQLSDERERGEEQDEPSRRQQPLDSPLERLIDSCLRAKRVMKLPGSVHEAVDAPPERRDPLAPVSDGYLVLRGPPRHVGLPGLGAERVADLDGVEVAHVGLQRDGRRPV